MLALIRRPLGPGGRRRGVTLVEMLVVVALVILMMVILVQIFQVATGAISESRKIQELDVTLRQVDSIIRTDLAGITAKMTPPNDPKDKRGYFEYGENQPADLQGEDSDDYLAFTTRAPEGKVFTGRQWLKPIGASSVNQSIQPATIQSQVAEIIYFLRNGNLYRRVMLVAPERATTLTLGDQGASVGYGYTSALFGGSLRVSWQGMNDISCRPQTSSNGTQLPIANDLGDLTNRENRMFHPRFNNDINPADGVPDDNNGDGIPDYYPTLYFDGSGNSQNGIGWAPDGHIHEAVAYPSNLARQTLAAPYGTNLYAFPFIYPGMYSVPDGNRVSNGLGWVHYLETANHAPLVSGDNLAIPDLINHPTNVQTWWGFPTWRETMAGASSGNGQGWTDPVLVVGRLQSLAQPLQSVGLQPLLSTSAPLAAANVPNLLPPVYQPGTNFVPPFFDGAGSSSFVAAPASAGSAQSVQPDPLWEDDLLLTGVRSFDVKAYDLSAPLYNYQVNNGYTNGPFSGGYQDLGYGANVYVGGPNGLGVTTQTAAPWQTVGGEPVGFGHEGRIPPLFSDFRYHPRYSTYNLGDNTLAVSRLVRVWDSWSTDYTNAPDSDIFLNGPPSNQSPIYPSFPPPYPSPLRGIQIQIRVTDPRVEKAKPITIRVDFTDKL